jgi:hypothetical protein
VLPSFAAEWPLLLGAERRSQKFLQFRTLVLLSKIPAIAYISIVAIMPATTPSIGSRRQPQNLGLALNMLEVHGGKSETRPRICVAPWAKTAPPIVYRYQQPA